jgi:cell division protein ZapA (FtsZ GTPase activity inhibitor)
METDIVTIALFGKSYSFKVDTGIEKARKVAARYEEEVQRVQQELAERSTTLTARTVLIMAALNIATENYELQERYNNLKIDVSEKTVGLRELLDASIPEVGGEQK